MKISKLGVLLVCGLLQFVLGVRASAEVMLTITGAKVQRAKIAVGQVHPGPANPARNATSI